MEKQGWRRLFPASKFQTAAKLTTAKSAYSIIDESSAGWQAGPQPL